MLVRHTYINIQRFEFLRTCILYYNFIKQHFLFYPFIKKYTTIPIM